jgi:membrane protein DedA with SNARE-associated domain
MALGETGKGRRLNLSWGRSLVEHKRFHRILSTDEKLLKFKEKFKKWSAWFLFFGRHFVGLRAQIFLTAGVMRTSLIKFLIADAAVEPHLYLQIQLRN